MSAKNGRQKGSIAEREVAALLQTWWRQLEPEVIFKRTPGSGGWASPDAREAFRTSGDIVTTAKTWPFCLEIKRREGWSWKTLRAGKPSPVHGWWAQAVRQAEEMSAEPLLVFRHNREPWWVAGRIDYFSRQCEGLVLLRVSFEFPISNVFAMPLACLLVTNPIKFC